MNKCQNSPQVVSVKEDNMILFYSIGNAKATLYCPHVDFYSNVWIFIAAPLLFATFVPYPIE